MVELFSSVAPTEPPSTDARCADVVTQTQATALLLLVLLHLAEAMHWWGRTNCSCHAAVGAPCRGNALVELLPAWMPTAMPHLRLLDVSHCHRLDLAASLAGFSQLETLAMQVRLSGFMGKG